MSSKKMGHCIYNVYAPRVCASGKYEFRWPHPLSTAASVQEGNRQEPELVSTIQCSDCLTALLPGSRDRPEKQYK